MTVTAIYTEEQFPIQGREYSFSFESIGSSAFEVYAVDSDDVRTLIPSNRYTVSFRGRRPIFDGGKVVFSNDPPVNAIGVICVRNTPIDQTVDWKIVERFPLVLIEFALDKLTMIAQELNDRLCETTPLTTPITQEIPFSEYTTFPASDVNTAVDKIFTIAAEMAANKTPDPNIPFWQGN